MTEVVYCDDNEIEQLKNTPEQEFNLPPRPVPMRPWREDDWRYQGSMDDYKLRIHDKLFKFWVLWGRLRRNAELEELLARYEEDKNGDAYVAKNCIVDIICEWSKILGDTDIVEELSWLQLSEEQFEQRKKSLEKKKQEECLKTGSS